MKLQSIQKGDYRRLQCNQLAKEIARSTDDVAQLEKDIEGCVQNEWMSDEFPWKDDGEDDETFKQRIASADVLKETAITTYRAIWVSPAEHTSKVGW